VNYRPEYTHGWGSKTYYRQLQIDPLPAQSAEALLDVLLGNDEALVPLKRLVIERTEGNPFFIEESVRSLVETGVLAGNRGAYRMTRVVQGVQVPATAQAMLAARIDRLAPEDKRLLQAAAVIGTDVPFDLLQAVVEGPEDQLRRGLSQLQATEFLYETRLFPDLEYTFRHALTHEVTYGSILQDRRRALHAQIVKVIEQLRSDRLGEQTERLAHHAVRGELWEKAVHYLRQAGLKATARSALSDARGWFEQALSILETLPGRQSTLEQAFDIRLELRTVLSLLGEQRRLMERLREAEALAERLDDDYRRARILTFMINSQAYFGELEKSLVTAARALEIADGVGDLRLRILCRSYFAEALFCHGDYERAIKLATDNLTELPADWRHDFFAGHGALPEVFDRAWIAMSLAELGKFTEGFAHALEAIQLARPTQHAFTIGVAYFPSRWLARPWCWQSSAKRARP
jgi:predicted ATPase